MEFSKTRYYDALNNQFNNFTSIEFVRKASNLIEKLIWIIIAVGGTGYIGQIMYVQLFVMVENPFVLEKETIDLLNLTHPAVTFCPKMTSELGIVEGLGNYLNLSEGIPPEAIVIRNELIGMYWRNRSKEVGCDISWSRNISVVNSMAYYYYYCCQDKFCQV